MENFFDEVKDSVPKIIKNGIIAVAIWMFGIIIFLPLSSLLVDDTLFGIFSVTTIISAIILIALLIIFFRTIGEIKDIIDAFAVHISNEVGTEKGYEQIFKAIGYVVVALIGYVLFMPFLIGIFNILAGIVLILLVFWTVTSLIKFKED